MKVVLAYGTRHQRIGGIQTWMTGLANGLLSTGHECEIFFIGSHAPTEKLRSDCKVRSGSLSSFLEVVAAERFDVVHASTADWDIGISVVRNIAGRTKLVLTNHGELYPNWTSQNCDAIVGCSSWSAKEQQEWTDIPVQTVPNGTDVEKFKPYESEPHPGPPLAKGRESTDTEAAGSPIVAWVGRSAHLEQKRIDRLAAMAPAICAAGYKLWIADPDGPEKAIPSAVSVLQPLAEFWGSLRFDEMTTFYQRVASSGGCILSTSDYEGLSMALMEAQACGCPIIGPDVRGVNEGVDPDHGGLLYPADMDPKEVAKLVVDTLSDKFGMESRRQASRQYMCDSFSIERMAAEYVRIYSEAPYPVLSQSGHRHSQGSPVTRVREHIRHHWSPGHSLYEASQELSGRGERGLASIAAGRSFAMCPSLYVKPGRLARLVRMKSRRAVS